MVKQMKISKHHLLSNSEILKLSMYNTFCNNTNILNASIIVISPLILMSILFSI